jgi:hypothetical protein
LTAFKTHPCRLVARYFAAVLVFAVAPIAVRAQASAVADLPDAPQSNQAPPAQNPPATAGQQNPQPETKEQQEQRAQQELKKEEKQRILGVVPMFNVQSNGEAAPLSPKQKFQLMFKSSTDPYIFGLTAITGGIGMAENNSPGYGQGVEGFSKYWAAAYADTFDGNFWGNAVLPAWWHEDPRYFRMGHGNFFKRAGYSAATTVWCKRDNGKWGPNYGNVVGNFIAGGISNLYYPANQRGLGETFDRGATVTYEGIVGAELAEFWPDIYQHFLNNYRRKKARKAAQQSGAGL